MFAVLRRQRRQLWYLPLLGAGMALMLARILLMAKLLNITEFAQFSAALLLSGAFCMLACLGLQPLLQRDMPIMLMRGRERASALLLMQCLQISGLCAGLGIAVALSGYSFAHLPLALMVVALLHGLTQQWFLVVILESRSRCDPVRYAQQNFWRSLGTLVLGGIVAKYSANALAVIGAEALWFLLLTGRLLQTIMTRARLSLIRLCYLGAKHLKNLPYKLAAIFALIGTADFVFLNLDRWLAAENLNAQAFAAYAFAAFILRAGQALQGLLNISVYSLLARRYVSLGRRYAHHMCQRLSLIGLLGATALVLPMWYLFQALVQHGYPMYAGTSTLALLFLITAAVQISNFWPSFLLIIGHERQMLHINLYVCVFGLFLWAGWTQAWHWQQLQLLDFGKLALLLTLMHYAACTVASWRATCNMQEEQDSIGIQP